MSWCHHTKLDAVREDRRRRREFAESVRKNCIREEFYATNIRLVEETIRDAKREDEMYAECFGETMPEHMRKAIEAEIIMWMTIHDLLFKPTVPEHCYADLCRKVRPFVSVLIDLLHAEEEMMGSPLVHHYMTLVETWRAQAARLQP